MTCKAYLTNTKNTLMLLGLVLLSMVLVALINPDTASAATLNVSSGTDVIAADSVCHLSEAIENINDQAQTNADCLAGDGNNDTIVLPTGTITLTVDLPAIAESVTIQGAGMGETVIDGDVGQYAVFYSNVGLGTLTISDLKITGFLGIAINNRTGNMSLSNIEIDGQTALGNDSENELVGVSISNFGASNIVNGTDLYVHDLNSSQANGVFGFRVANQNATTTTAIFNNTTVANISNGSSDAMGFTSGVIGGGNISVTAINTTVDSITASGAAYGFGSFGIANGFDVLVTILAQNVTVSGLSGSIGQFGGPSLAFFAGVAATAPNTSTVNVEVENSLLTNNLSDGESSNCGLVNVNDAFGYTGTVDVSVTSLGHNISDDDSCTSFTEEGDQQNVSNILTTLGPLQNNGGSVPTRALLPGSPAIAAGSAVLGITTDARGVARSNGWDVGAYQSNLGVSTGGEDSEGNGDSDGDGSGGELADTGQNILTGLMAALFIASLAGMMVLAKRKTKKSK